MSGQKKFFCEIDALMFKQSKSLDTGVCNRLQLIQITIQNRPIHKLGRYYKHANVRVFRTFAYAKVLQMGLHPIPQFHYEIQILVAKGEKL